MGIKRENICFAHWLIDSGLTYIAQPRNLSNSTRRERVPASLFQGVSSCTPENTAVTKQCLHVVC